MNQLAALDRAPPATAIAMDGQQLPVTAWADVNGVIVAPAAARFCAAGPDADGREWLIDIKRQRRVR